MFEPGNTDRSVPFCLCSCVYEVWLLHCSDLMVPRVGAFPGETAPVRKAWTRNLGTGCAKRSRPVLLSTVYAAGTLLFTLRSFGARTAPFFISRRAVSKFHVALERWACASNAFYFADFRIRCTFSALCALKRDRTYTCRKHPTPTAVIVIPRPLLPRFTRFRDHTRSQWALVP